MNSDDLEKAEREGGVSFADYIVNPQLDDTDGGGLFGIRFDTPIPAETPGTEVEP